MLVVFYLGTLGSIILPPVRSQFAYRMCFCLQCRLTMGHFRGTMRPPSEPSEARRARRPTSMMRHFKGAAQSMICARAAAKKSPHRRYYSFDHLRRRAVKRSHRHDETPLPQESYKRSTCEQHTDRARSKKKSSGIGKSITCLFQDAHLLRGFPHKNVVFEQQRRSKLTVQNFSSGRGQSFGHHRR